MIVSSLGIQEIMTGSTQTFKGHYTDWTSLAENNALPILYCKINFWIKEG